MNEHIEVECQDGIQIIRINRPARKNALTTGMYYSLAEAINAAQTDNAVRVCILTGVADCFTSGNDIGDFVSQSEQPLDQADEAGSSASDSTSETSGKRKNRGPVPELLSALMNADKPMIAAVNGIAIGIGTTMLFHFDLVYASTEARFAMPFINLGVVPEAGSSLLAPLALGKQRAAELFLFGEQFNTQTAIEGGFVNDAFVPDELMPEVMQRAATLASKAPSAIRQTKALMRRFGPELQAVMDAEMDIFAAQLRTPESKEAMQAFVERRPADFSKFH